MSVFGKSLANVAVIDIRSSSIGAAYAVVGKKQPLPRLVYSARIPIDPHATEPLAEALPRTLEKVLTQLVKEGAPLLRAASGSGRVDRVLVTFTAPWQHSTVFSRVIEREKPFIFTREVLQEAVREQAGDAKGRTRVSEMVIATLLNGYEIENPFGKRASHAELILLSSSIDTEVMDLVTKQVRKSLHQPHIECNAFLPEVFVSLRELYPHQRDFLVMDVGGDATDVLMVKHGLLISTSCMADGVNEMARAARSLGLSSPTVPIASLPAVDMTRSESSSSLLDRVQADWLSQIRNSLAEIAKQEPLPRTVLLLAEENVRDFLRVLLDAPQLRALWLSDESLAVLPILPTQFIPFLEQLGSEGADPALALLVRAIEKRVG